MLAFFDGKDNSPKVVLKVYGTNKKEKEIIALVDTGHNGSLSLPVLVLIEIGATLSSIEPIQLADNSIVIGYNFSVNVILDGKKKKVEATLIPDPEETEAIAGLQLFTPYIAFIDFKNKIIDIKTEKQIREKLAINNSK
ncbi:hypothetical protein M1271_02315 [Patescibacteria group bacterium]|nr:hypothetical protein [Patescibacteria group bacterium]